MNAVDRAMAYLAARPKTKHQIIEYLRKKGYSDTDIEDAVSQLEEYHFIDDFRFCEMYFELGFDKGRGIDRIKRELADKGVSAYDIEDALASLDNIPSQSDMALSIAQKVAEGYDIGAMSYDERRKLMAKIIRKLAGRGFSGDVSYSAAKKAMANQNE